MCLQMLLHIDWDMLNWAQCAWQVNKNSNSNLTESSEKGEDNMFLDQNC